MLTEDEIKSILEAALLAVSEPLNVDRLFNLFVGDDLDEQDGRSQIRAALKTLQEDAGTRGVELRRVASGYRYQIKQDLSAWVSRLWEEKPPRYSRALLETLALIAYKQPVTRGDIEQVRGVSVSQNIMRTMLERGWIRVVGQREVPGRPSLYATTRAFLDYFNVKSLDELPELPEIKALIDPLAEIAEPEINEVVKIQAVEVEELPDSLEESAEQALEEAAKDEDKSDLPLAEVVPLPTAGTPHN